MKAIFTMSIFLSFCSLVIAADQKQKVGAYIASLGFMLIALAAQVINTYGVA